MTRLQWIALVCLAIAAALPRPARACAVAPRAGEQVHVEREEAVIVWDGKRKVEHFIRRATFQAAGGATEFGFLVPTPARPELAEADGEIFGRIEEAIEDEREVVDESRFELGMAIGLLEPIGCKKGEKAVTKSAAPPPVRVLEEKQVAGLDATVLEADDPVALAAWLGQHGFENRAALVDWLAPYVAARWKITALRQRAGSNTAGRALRMSFAAGAPLFPYREPSDAVLANVRSLRVYLVADHRMDGTLGDDGAAWPAEIGYAGRLPGLDEILQDAVPEGAIGAEPWLTAFLDRSTRREQGELLFAAAAKDAPVAPPPIVDRGIYIIPVDLILLAGIPIGILLSAWIRRRAARARATSSAAP